MMLSRIGSDHQVFAPILDVTEGPAILERQPGDAQLFGMHDDLVTEAAAHIGGDHPDPALVDAKKLRKSHTDDMRDLRRIVDHQLVAALVPVGKDRLALHRHHGLAIKRQFPLDHNRRALRVGVISAVEVQAKERIVIPLLVHAHAFLEARCERVDQHGEFVELNLDFFRQIFGFSARGRNAHRDCFAHIAHLVMRQRMPFGELVAGHRGRRDHGGRFFEVRPDEHALFATRRLRNAADATVSNRAAQKGHFALAWQDHVRDITASSTHESRIFLAAHPRPYALSCDFLHRACPLLSTRPARVVSAAALT